MEPYKVPRGPKGPEASAIVIAGSDWSRWCACTRTCSDWYRWQRLESLVQMTNSYAEPPQPMPMPTQMQCSPPLFWTRELGNQNRSNNEIYGGTATHSTPTAQRSQSLDLQGSTWITLSNEPYFPFVAAQLHECRSKLLRSTQPTCIHAGIPLHH